MRHYDAELAIRQALPRISSLRYQDYFRFSRWRLAAILNIENHKILFGEEVERHITVPDFVKSGQSVVMMLQFFSIWRPSAILDLFGGAYLDQQLILDSTYWSLSLCKIW